MMCTACTPLRAVARTGRRDLVDQREHRLFDEFDQSLEHLRLAREVPVQRRLAHLQARRQRGGGDALAVGLLQHRRQGLQDLDPPLARLGTFSAGRLGTWFGVFGDGTGIEVGHGGSGAGVRIILAQRLSG